MKKFQRLEKDPAPTSNDWKNSPLPEGWRWVKLGEVCRFVNGDAYRDSDWSRTGTPIIRIQNLNNHEKPFNYWAGTLDDRVVVKDGDLLLAWSGTPGTSFGAHIWTRGRAVLNQHIFRVDYDRSKMDSIFGLHAINERLIVLIGKAHGGVGLRHVTKREVENLEIPLPPLSEQRRIAGILKEQMAAIAQARAAAEAQLAAARALPAAFLREVFNSPEAQKWPRRKLGELLTLRKEVVHPRENPRGKATFVGLEHIESGTGARIGSVHLEMSSLTGRKPKFYSGDIVYGYLRPYLNKVWLAEFDGLCSVDQYVYLIRGEMVDSTFLSWFMRSPIFLQRAPISTTPGQLPRIRTEEVALVEVNLPPLNHQRRIASQLSARMAEAERVRRGAEAQLAEIERLPAAVLRRAFRGEL